MKITNSENLFERSKKVSPGGVHSPVRGFRGVGGTPRFIQEARGAEIKDVDGNQYIDYCMSWGPLILGHQDEEVAEAVKRAIGRGWSYGAAEPYSLELAEFMTGAMPWLEKVRFVNSGTEAVMAALRLARGATGRHKILKFDGCYHGHVDSMLVRAGSGLAEMASPDSAGVSRQVAAETIVAPLNDLSAMKAIFETHGSEIAAVIVEPIPANNGLLIPQDGFLSELCGQARKQGALVIFDEVITGFRVAFGGMAEKTGLRPDLVTYGKIIGGGFPVGAYGGRRDLMDQIAPMGAVYQAGTLSANPVSMSAGLATLKKLRRLMPYGELENRTETLSNGIEELAKRAGVSMRVQRAASLFWMVFGAIKTKDGIVRAASETPVEQKEKYAKLFHGLLSKGVYLAPSGFEVSFLSLAHGKVEIERTLHAIEECLKA